MVSDLTFSLPQLQEERQRLKRKQAADLFAPLYTIPFTRVEISGCSVPDEAAIVAAKGLQALAKKKCLRELVLSDCIAGLPTDEALKSLTTLCEAIGTWKGLRSVDFSSNALGSRGVAACSAVLKDQPLEEVLFSNNGLAAPSIKLIRKYLCHDKETELKVFHCTLNCVQSAGFLELVDIVKCSPKLQEIKLSSLRAEADATLQLCISLQVFDDLRVLDISDNALNEQGALALGIALKKQTKLEMLMLRDLALSDDELSTILEPLMEAKAPLDMLDLSGNEISAEGCSLVVAVIATFAETLRTLLLADNEIFDSGTLRIANALSLMDTCELQDLTLSGNMIRDFAAIIIAEEVVKLSNFAKLDLDENYIGEKALSAIQRCIGDMLESTEKMVPEDERDEVQEDEPADEAEVEAAIERLMARADSRSSQSSNVPELIAKFEESTIGDVGSSSSNAAASEPSTVVDTVQSAMTTSAVTDEGFESPSSKIGSTSSGPTGDTSAAGGEEVTPRPYKVSSAFKAGSSRDEVFSSAKKLNRDLQDIKQSLTGFVSELNEINSETVPQQLAFGDSERGILVDLDRVDKQNRSSVLFDVLGGFLMAIFVVILVLSIAKSQEETTFSYRPV